MKQKLILPFVAALLLLPAFEKTLDSLPKPVGESCPADLEAIRIPACNETFYADLADYWLSPPPTTKASSSETEYVSLESLLDHSLAETEETDDYTLVQIPFRSNKDQMRVRVSSGLEEFTVQDSLSVISKFYIECYCGSKLETAQVATMITKPDYLEKGRNISFLYKPNYSGIILYSDLDGTLTYLYSYDNGGLISSRILHPDELSESGDVEYISIIASGLETRGEDDEKTYPIEECFVTADAPVRVYKNEESDDGFESALPENGFSGGGGGGAGSDSGKGGSSGDKVKKNLSKLKSYSLSLSSNKPSFGQVLVSPPQTEYEKGSIVHVSESHFLGWFFYYWTGDFAKCSGSIVVTMTKNITSTANFFPIDGESHLRPCVDTTANKANPLKSMAIAPCYNKDGVGSGIKGATYGDVRWGNKHHGGIDFAAEVGTPVYSMYDGTVAKTVSNQVNRYEETNKYPKGYTGERNDGGNRINISCNVNGTNRTFSYMHLNESSPIAVNPRTGLPFKEGDIVYQGELIGYTGVTGNAITALNSHLHLGVYNGKEDTDPSPYINGTIYTDRVEIDGTKCDDLTEGSQKNVYP